MPLLPLQLPMRGLQGPAPVQGLPAVGGAMQPPSVTAQYPTIGGVSNIMPGTAGTSPQDWWRSWLSQQAAAMQNATQQAHQLGPFANQLTNPNAMAQAHQLMMMQYLMGGGGMGGGSLASAPTDSGV